MSEEFFDCSVILLDIDRIKRQIYANILNDKNHENEALTEDLLVAVRRLNLWVKTMKDEHADRNH
jgi:hypothetical protein